MQNYGKDKIQLVKFVVEGVVFQIKRQLFLPQVDDSQKKAIQEVLLDLSKKVVLPNWVSSAIFALFQQYLTYKSLDAYKEYGDDAGLLIQTLRLTDYLGMYKFQEKFINDIITPSINIGNCVIFLEETHRKLKNQENGSQCWYSLLNASITFLALNLKEVYKISSDKLKRLHEKILNQVLDRSIRNGNVDEQMIFELIMQSRKVANVENLCQVLRSAIQNKKINPKIHAKLSWKLQDVANIKDKKTKNFKFLDLDWLLEATRADNDDLNVKLTYCGVNDKSQIGAFYVKVMWWIDGKAQEKRQQKIRISYILMNKREQLNILNLTPKMQTQLGKGKIQLSIFCCLDQIYTFTLNYLARNHEKVEVEERKLTAQELAIIVLLLKQKKQYSSSIRFMKFLACVKGDVPQQYLADFPFSQLTPYEIDFIQKMSIQRVVQVDLNHHLAQSSDIRSSANQSRRSEERPESRGRLRKIFASSPSRSVANDSAPVKFEEIGRISDIKNYFYDKSSIFYNQL